MPSIAAVNGVAAGAGASLAMTCDIAIAAPTASFIQAFSKIGLVPDAGGSWFLPQRLGLARAMGLALTGDKLTATQARDWGMIWDIADDPLASGHGAWQNAWPPCRPRPWSPPARCCASASTHTLDAHLDVERDTQSAMGATHDYIEGVSAFLQKRPPAFTGQ